MVESIHVARLATGTVYKLVFIGLLCGFVPLFALFGVMGSMDLVTLTWNEEPLTGVRALIAGPFMGVLFALLFTALVGSVMALGLWIYGRFRGLTVDFTPGAGAE
jgi:Na+-transporting NADH:ubiquinone oxidoreductase subunit NqrB